MKKILKKIIKKALQAAVIGACLTVPAMFPSEAMEFLPVSEVREGMQGYAKTVVHGTKIDTFQVEVLGVMKNKGATGGDLVLVRVSGPVIDETHGIAQGMSGSPVYINGKLLGAIAYGFPQSNGRIGMVTPISDMLNLWTVTDKKWPALDPAANPDLIPISTPLMASGYTKDGLNYLSDKMKSFNMIPVAASSAGADETPRPLEPGGAVAATLVTGDLKLGALGTVTYVDGNRMVAFGHPFMNRGNSGYFMHNSWIYTIVPSENIPFKLGTVGAEIGKINEDRGAGISGISGEIPSYVSLHAAATDLDTGNVKNLNVRMMEEESLLPTLSATSIYNAVSNVMDRSGSGTVSFSYSLIPKDLKERTFTRKNMYWSNTDIAARSVDEIYNVIRLLENNRFSRYTLQNVKMNLEVTKERKTAQLLDASAFPIIVSPGDMIYIRVRLQPYRGDIEYKDLTFVVPKDQPLGDMELEVRGGGVIPLPYLIQQQQYNLTDEIINRIRTYKDFNDLFDQLENEDQNNQVVAEILDPNVSMITKDESQGNKAEIQDKKSDETPDYLKKQNDKNAIDKKNEYKSRVDTDYVVLGDGQFTFKVMKPADRDAALKKLAKEKQKTTAAMSDKEKNSILKKEETKTQKDHGSDESSKAADVENYSTFYEL